MEFKISRINTERGIFRLSGELNPLENSNKLKYSRIEFMGTDGWVELDLYSKSGQLIISDIEPSVIEHLLTKS